MRMNSMLAAMSNVGSWTLLSRILGFIREVIFAAMFGSSATAEAFQVAFSLPNLFRRFFGEGAMNTAFVPMYAKKLENGEDALEFIQNVFSVLALILCLLIGIALIAMPLLVLMMASGFSGDERFDLAVDFGRVCFPYIFFISLSALASGALNAHNRFTAAAAAPILLNVVLIPALWFGPKMGIAAEQALIWAVPIGGILQLALVWSALAKIGIKLIPSRPIWNSDVKKLLIIMLPATLAGGVVQINLLVGRQVASQFEGAIQWLAVADRLYQLPLGVVGIAIGIVLLPTLSKAVAAKDEFKAQTAFNESLMFAAMLVLPATAALTFIPGPIIEAMFEHGAFNGNDTANAAAALSIYGAGLPAFVGQKLYQPSFFSRGDTRKPFHYAIFAMISNAVIAIGLMPWFGFIAAALATTVSSYLMLVLLMIGSRRAGKETKLSGSTLKSICVSFVASTVLAISFYPIHWAADQFGINKYSELALYVIIGLALAGSLLLLPENRRLLRR